MGRATVRLIARLIAVAFVALAATAPVSHAQTPQKTVFWVFQESEKGFDPAQESDHYSAWILEAVFDAPLTYDYLARPVKLKPNTLSSLPEVTDNGATYTLHIKPGIYFHDDPVFKGAKRELTAQDYAYSFLRMYDPKLKSPVLFLVEGKIKGADERRKAAAASGTFDYDAPVEGLEVLDRYTLRIRLTETDYNFGYVLATPTLGAVAREVMDAYGSDARHRPIGTGAFVFKRSEYVRTSKIVLERNPGYREELFDAQPEKSPLDEGIVQALRGKRLPIIDRVEVSIIDEPQPRWLSFLNSEIDVLENVPNDFVTQAAPGNQLAPNLAKRGVGIQRPTEMELIITGIYNMEHPVIGGYAPDKVALRRAINLAYNTPDELLIARKGQALVAESVIPPDVAGYDPNFRGIGNVYDPSRAKALLDMFGYVDCDGDGWRDLPGCKPLEVEIAAPPSSDYKALNEVWDKSLTAVGIKSRFKIQKWQDLVVESRTGKLQLGSFLSWHADYPDAENFFQLLYGPNTGQSNDARFNLPEFNKLYEASRKLPDGPERNALYDKMNRLVVAYAPWKLGFQRIRTHLNHPWLRNFKKHPIMRPPWKWLDVDVAAQSKARKAAGIQ